MDCLLRGEGELGFWVSDTFSGTLLVPILKNMLVKAEAGWDDYNEAYHCCRLIETVKENPGLTMEFHSLRRGRNVLGVCLVTHGRIEGPLFFPEGFQPPEKPEQILVLNYFHIAPEGRGNGEHWLRDLILPHYREKGYEALYVKSSHPRAFSLYTRLGQPVGEYLSNSDNGLYTRPGKLFRIPLNANGGGETP